MLRTYGDFVWRSLFPDALSGEFTPASDPERKHTLSRLAVAAAIKGRPGDENAFEYSPSWSKSAKVTIECDNTSAGWLVTGVALRRQGDENDEYAVDVNDVTNDEGMAVNLLVGQGDLQTYELELGEKLAVARRVITAVAEKFFEK